MTGNEPTYAARSAIARLQATANDFRIQIIRSVLDPQSRVAALAALDQAVATAVAGVNPS